MRILLIQARDAGDPMQRHELECFARHTGLSIDAFTSLNLPVEPHLAEDPIVGFDAVMVGGSGDYSVVEGGFDWHETLLDLMRRVVQRRIPTFASCFGFQALAQAFGGTVVRRPEHAEVGSFVVTLTEAGKQDDLMGDLPPRFMAQFGHKDSVVELPPGFVHLAYSERCPHQALRVRHAPVIATQFHPELSRDSNFERFSRYIEQYKGAQGVEVALEEAEKGFFPSTESSALLRRFVANL